MQVFLQTMIGGLSLGAVYALVAMGFSLVYRTMGLVNFAHGDVLMIGAYTASTFYTSTRLPFAVAMVSAIAVTGLIGLVIERVLRPLENKDVTLMLIGTIGFGMVLQALAILIWGATGRECPAHGAARAREIAGNRLGGQPRAARAAPRSRASGRHGPTAPSRPPPPRGRRAGRPGPGRGPPPRPARRCPPRRS